MARAARRKATIYDIATAAEASASTVSLVLNGTWARYRIKEDTAHRITEAAKTLGYNVNLTARGLRLSRSGLAGMILPHYRNRFFADLAEAFESEARQRGLCPIVVSTQREEAVEATVTRTLLAQRVEFLFITGVPNPEPLDRLCASATVPCVNIDLPGPGAPSVVSDNRAGARHLTNIMMEKVLRRGGSLEAFLYLGGVAGEYATDTRVAGFVDALRTKDIEPGPQSLALSGYPPGNARDALASYYDRHGRLPSGLFINSIAAFEGAIEFASRLPAAELEEFVACCFDWDPFAACLPFDVTMLRQDVETMMERAFDALKPEPQEDRPLVLVPAVLAGRKAAEL
ncbi:LacI family DNA-binding transcriptional regulator [Lichenifustis flavocetrariae]|uniref:LacI family DNA-binding transcriptional regulator n=1 Tax=Lichenifustis flavocetrariae TaxID=2949735 RepID=A0AA41Z299_9HYPH|nr:LacI family DNA-binding transcriptional regulator [Lichenifustis flavocetrariae]MCW6509188.1 LacI family DNA-binding transcriptional regulator [Lichenifustis flavocetrariae]